MLSFFPKKIIKNEKGFGIMEVLVSVAIISFSFVGIMSLFAFNLRVEQMNRNKIIGSYLAQEAIEVIRQKRDNNWFTGQAWDNGIGSGQNLVVSMDNYLDPTQSWSVQQGANINAEIYKQKVYFVNNRYVQTVALSGDSQGWQYTNFRRMVKITDDAPDRKKIEVSIYYKENVLLLSVTTYLYDKWY